MKKLARKPAAPCSPDRVFFNKILDACDLQKVALRPAINFLDAMCGSGRLGLEVKERVRQTFQDRLIHFAFYFNDVAHEPLMKLEGEFTAPGDVRELSQKFPGYFHVAAVRYGIKDLPQQEQLNALVSLRDSLVPGGRLVIADMTAYNVGQQDAIITVHAMHQRLTGRDEKAEGRCHIPTIMEWELLANSAGFKNVRITHVNVSRESTSQWAAEFGSGVEAKMAKIRFMNILISDLAVKNSDFLKSSKVTFAKSGSGDSETLEATLDFPIMVLAADKPGG